VRDAANLDLESVGGLLNDGYVFLLGGIHGVFLEELHWLAAAYQLAPAAVQHLDNVSTQIAFVDLKLFGHDMSPFGRKG
jgi:hypothetical protein